MTLSEQFATMIAMTAMGLWIGASLTTYHRLIRPKGKWHWMMIITDTFFWILQGLLIFYVLLDINQGQVRFYIFLALILGYASYKALFEKIYQKVLEATITIIISIATFIQKAIMILFIKPVFGLLMLVFLSCKILGRFLLSILLFFLTIIYLPFKWLIPTLVINKVKALSLKVIDVLLKIFKRPK